MVATRAVVGGGADAVGGIVATSGAVDGGALTGGISTEAVPVGGALIGGELVGGPSAGGRLAEGGLVGAAVAGCVSTWGVQAGRGVAGGAELVSTRGHLIVMSPVGSRDITTNLCFS